MFRCVPMFSQGINSRSFGKSYLPHVYKIYLNLYKYGGQGELRPCALRASLSGKTFVVIVGYFQSTFIRYMHEDFIYYYPKNMATSFFLSKTSTMWILVMTFCMKIGDFQSDFINDFSSIVIKPFKDFSTWFYFCEKSPWILHAI